MDNRAKEIILAEIDIDGSREDAIRLLKDVLDVAGTILVNIAEGYDLDEAVSMGIV